MNRLNAWLLAAAFSTPLAAMAQLPAPSAEEAVQKAAAVEKKALGEEAAKAALARAQERVASRYRARHPNAPRAVPVLAAKK